MRHLITMRKKFSKSQTYLIMQNQTPIMSTKLHLGNLKWSELFIWHTIRTNWNRRKYFDRLMLSLILKVSWIRFISHAPIMKSFCLISWIEASMQMLDMGLIRWISKKKICWYIILKECGIIKASLEFHPRYFNDGPF